MQGIFPLGVLAPTKVRVFLVAIPARGGIEAQRNAGLVTLVQTTRPVAAFALNIAALRQFWIFQFQGIPIARLQRRRELPTHFVLHIVKTVVDRTWRIIKTNGVALRTGCIIGWT